MKADILHPDLKTTPYWWEAYTPSAGDLVDVPKKVRVAIVGGGYAGLSCAIELHEAGIDSVVLESKELGFGASTRSGGGVSGGVNIGKTLTGRKLSFSKEMTESLYASSADSFQLIEEIIERENIQCYWQKNGKFLGAPTPELFETYKKRAEILNTYTNSIAALVPRDQQRAEVATDFYFGGMTVQDTALVHPALYYKGLLDAAQRRSIPVCAYAEVQRIEPVGKEWRISTSRGEVLARDVVIATNGYTGRITKQLKRRLVPIVSHMIATEELPENLAKTLIPNYRTCNTTRRVSSYYRMSPDGKRLLFGGRARFTPTRPEKSAVLMHRFMTEVFPQLKDFRVTHTWQGNIAFTFDSLPHTGVMDGMHYALGCGGSGVAMMTYLGHQTARRIIGGANKTCGYEREEFPTFPFYGGNPDFVLPFVGSYFRFRDRMERKAALKRDRRQRGS